MAELSQLANVTTSNGYSEAGATIADPQRPDPFVAVELDITGAAVFFKVQEAKGRWSADETFSPPRVGVLALGAAWGIQFRSAVAGTPAQISARMLTRAQIDAAGGLGAFSAPSYTVDPSGNVQPITSGDVIPAGTILAYAAGVAPPGWVLCDGTHYDGTQSAYAALWGVLGNGYGGISQADFAVPDLRGRVIVGEGTNASVNALGKNEGVALASRRPHHRHTVGNGVNLVRAGGPPGRYPTNAGVDGSPVTPTVGADPVNDPLDAPAYLVLNYIVKL